MSAICQSNVSSLELLICFECGPCVEVHVNADADAARLRSKCKVSIGS